jgi:hypothetical protein
MASVAEMVVRISVNLSGLDRGLAQATTEIETFAHTVDGSRGSLDDMGKSTERAASDVDRLGTKAKSTRSELDKWESHIPLVGGLLDKMNRSALGAAGSLLQMIPGMEGLGQSIQSASPVLAAFLSWGEAIPAALFIALFAVNALADGMGVLLAVVGDLIAPVTLVTGLLGGLAAGFVIGAERAAQGGGKLQAFADKLATLKSMFSHTADVLAHVFLPYLLQLATDAQHALQWLDKIVKMPLGKALSTAAQQGAQGFKRFLDQIGGWLAKPIRLAVAIAFGTGKGGNEMSSAVSGLWNEFTRYWLGYTTTQRVPFGPNTFKVTTTTVDGALQPFLDWFDRHDFTTQGKKIAGTLMKGLDSIKGPLSTLLVSIIEDSGEKAARTMWNVFKTLTLGALGWMKDHAATTFALIFETLTPSMARRGWSIVKQLAGAAWDAIKARAGQVWDSIKSHAVGVANSIAGKIEGALESAWRTVRNAASNAWDKIKGWFSQLLHVHISWPSPPSWVNKLLGAGGSVLHNLSGGVVGATGGIVTRPTLAVIGEAGPEAVVPLNRTPGSSPLPSPQAGGRRGGDVNLTVVVTGNTLLAQSPDVARQLAALLTPYMGRIVTVGVR